jgi:hypothetical protein
MPITDQKTIGEAPDNVERTALRDAFPRQGRVRIVDVVVAAGVMSIDMAAIGLAGRHVRLTVRAGTLAYFFEARSSATPPVQTTPNSTLRATFDVLGKETANPAGQASTLLVNETTRRFVSAKFPMLQMNGVGAGAQIELEDATI